MIRFYIMSDQVPADNSKEDGGQHSLKVGDIEIYYHALYHHIAHWTAYIAMIATLIAIGASLSAFQGVMAGFRIVGAAGVIFAAWLGAWYFIRGMDTYGAILCESVPKWYLARTHTFPHKRTIAIGKLAATLAAVVDLALMTALAYPFSN